jgi:aryl-alcohol dehydrogenase-like predicted oxidoreductase
VSLNHPSAPKTAELAGRATAEGTRRYRSRHAAALADDFFRPLTRDAINVSSIGIGTYLGQCDDADDDVVGDTVRYAVGQGINFIDTAINYRCQRAERSVGSALSACTRTGDVARDELVVCTKGGYVPLDGSAPASRDDYRSYLESEYFDRGIMAPDDVVAGGHCLAPEYLADQIGRSRRNLGLRTIDIYLLHNPEQQLDAIEPPQLHERLRAAFILLEAQCASGSIGTYGCATWSGLRVAPGERGHLSLVDLVTLAREVGGDSHHFAVIQLPLNLALTEAVRAPTQQVAGRMMSVLEAAAELGVGVVASATLLQGKLTAGLPEQVRDAIPGMSSDAQRAIGFSRSLPILASALVGMKSRAHVDENLGAARRG